MSVPVCARCKKEFAAEFTACPACTYEDTARREDDDVRDRRDRFICAALAGMLADPNVDGEASLVAERVVMYADATLAEADRVKT